MALATTAGELPGRRATSVVVALRRFRGAQQPLGRHHRRRDYRPGHVLGCKWEAAVSPAADAREEAQRDKANRKAAEQEQREGEHRERLLVVLRQTPGGDTERALSRAAGLNPENFGRAVFSLLQEGRAARCEVVKTGRNYDGFRPTGR